MTYLPILDHPTWITDQGEGPPAVLLHGAFHGSDALLPVFKFLAEGRRLVSFDRRGHGRTADTSDAFHYESMTDETVDVFKALKLPAADLVGYSDGGIVALHLALRRPDLVRSLVLVGTNLLPSGAQVTIDPESALTASMRRSYGAVSPDGEAHFDVVAAKSLALFAVEPTFDQAALARITVPVLILVGDRDAVPLSETVTLFETLPRAQLAVIPGASHHVIWERPDEVYSTVHRFLGSGRRAR